MADEGGAIMRSILVAMAVFGLVLAGLIGSVGDAAALSFVKSRPYQYCHFVMDQKELKGAARKAEYAKCIHDPANYK
ncbi:MAG: hypothetical protein ABSC22_11350 [Roseiarcus sp.]